MAVPHLHRMKLVLGVDESPLDAHQLPLLAGEPALRAGGELLGAARVAGRERRRDRRPLPQVVVVDLGDRGAEAVLELRLRRQDMLALPLQRARLGEVELGDEDRDEAGAQDSSAVAAAAPAGAGSSSDVRSTSRVS
jgi:hypothetical protein